MVNIGTCSESSVEEGEWVPLMQLEKDLTNIHLSLCTPKANANQWCTVRHYKLARRDFNVVMQAKLHRILRSQRHGGMTRVIIAYPDSL
jgi:hypothetical protein